MPPSNRFPILRLPLLPFQLFTESLTPLDIFSLALTSHKLGKLSSKLKNLELTQGNPGEFRVSLSNGDSDYQLIVHSVLPELWQYQTRNRKKMVKIDGKQYSISYDSTDPRVLRMLEGTEDSAISKETIFWIFKLLSGTFTSQKVIVKFCYVPKDVVIPVVTTNFQKITTLELNNPFSELTSDELSSLLESNLVEYFELNWNVEEGVKYRNSLKCPTMTLSYAHWLTIDCLLDMDCVSLNASDVLLTIQDVKKFVTKWLEGGFEKLEEVWLYHQIEEMSWKSVMDDFEKKPYEQANREEHLIMVSGSPNEWKIERSDGKRAAVVENNNSFIFVIL